MSFAGFYIIITGFAIIFAAFVGAASNMAINSDNPSKMMPLHFAAMIAIIGGGMISATGIVLAIIEAITFYG